MASVLEILPEGISGRSIGRICKKAEVPTAAADAGEQIADSDRSRLRRLLDAMWIPPATIDVSHWKRRKDVVTVQDISGREFVFRSGVIDSGKGRQRARVIKCWHFEDDEIWILEELLRKLPTLQRKNLRDEYLSLQERAAGYVTRIMAWDSAIKTEARMRIRDYIKLRMEGRGFGPSDELAQTALSLEDEAQNLNVAIAAFKRTLLAIAGT
jgi:hypothetical protein